MRVTVLLAAFALAGCAEPGIRVVAKTPNMISLCARGVTGQAIEDRVTAHCAETGTVPRLSRTDICPHAWSEPEYFARYECVARPVGS
jgi:hypothetical protein